MSTVRIPADIDQDDRLLAGLTARQLVILAIPTIVLWVLFMATRSLIPLVVFAPIAVIISGIAAALVVSKRDGVSMDRFVLAAIRHQRSDRRLVTISDELIALPQVTSNAPFSITTQQT